MKLTSTEHKTLETAREDLWAKIGPKRKNEIRELRDPIKNPQPDGRIKAWTGKKYFESGRYIRKLWRDGSETVYLVDGGAFASVGGDAAKAIVAASVPVEPEGITEVLAVDADQIDTHGGPRTILGVLLLNGTITRAQIRAAEDALDADEDLYRAI